MHRAGLSRRIPNSSEERRYYGVNRVHIHICYSTIIQYIPIHLQYTQHTHTEDIQHTNTAYSIQSTDILSYSIQNTDMLNSLSPFLFFLRHVSLVWIIPLNLINLQPSTFNFNLQSSFFIHHSSFIMDSWLQQTNKGIFDFRLLKHILPGKLEDLQSFSFIPLLLLLLLFTPSPSLMH